MVLVFLYEKEEVFEDRTRNLRDWSLPYRHVTGRLCLLFPHEKGVKDVPLHM